MSSVAVERVEARFELDVGPSDGSLRMDGRAAVERAGDIADACVATADFRLLAILAREVDVGYIWDDVDALAAWLAARGA